jgi:hypothetical protein
MKHEIGGERKSPSHVLVMCKCGWRFETTRHQNAFARSAKIKAAVRAHLKENPEEPQCKSEI